MAAEKYDPKKQYQWKEEDVFEVKGNQFGLMLNAFRSILSKPESQEVMLLMRAETEMTKVLAEAVNKGKISEMVTPLEK